MRCRNVAAVLAALLTAFAAGAGPGTVTAPLAVEVLFGPGGGPDRFRVDFRDALLLDLRARGCFPAIVGNDDDGILLFRVTLEAPVAESLNDLSLHGSLTNEEQYGTASTTTRIRIYAVMEILLPGAREIFRSKRIRAEASYRATFAWEDGAAEARDELILGLASQVAGYACKADGKKLQKKLQETKIRVSPPR
jgi:hypothetical protein